MGERGSRGGELLSSTSSQLVWRLVTASLWIVGLTMLPTYVNGFSMPKSVAWIALGFLLIGSQWVEPPKRSRVSNVWCGALFVWVSLLFVGLSLWPRLWVPQNLEPTVAYRWVVSTILPTVTCWVSFLVMDVLIREGSSADQWAQIGLHECALAGVIALYGLAQAVGIDPFLLGERSVIGYVTRNAMITVFGNPMLTANCLAILAPFCLIFKPSWCRVVYGLVLVDLLVIQSVLSLAAVFCGSSLVWGFRRQWRPLSILSGLGVVGLAWLGWHHRLGAFVSFSSRQQMWGTAVAMWRAHPWQAWCGFGLGSVEALTTQKVWSYGTLHCEPLQILFETGLIGFTLMVGWLWRLGRRLWHLPKDTLRMGWIASAVSFGIVACGSFPLHVGSLLLLGVLIVSALETFAEDFDDANYPA